jgi:hypothetical protein
MLVVGIVRFVVIEFEPEGLHACPACPVSIATPRAKCVTAAQAE